MTEVQRLDARYVTSAQLCKKIFAFYV